LVGSRLQFLGWTPVNVKLLLPPRQSRGISSPFSFREQIDTGGPLGRAIIIIVGAVAELERSLIVERVRAGMRRARLEGQHTGRTPLVLDHAEIAARARACARLPKATVSRQPLSSACSASISQPS
jgi:DNA invertase Pin-like site-specific DNA recombinase